MQTSSTHQKLLIIDGTFILPQQGSDQHVTNLKTLQAQLSSFSDQQIHSIFLMPQLHGIQSSQISSEIKEICQQNGIDYEAAYSNLIFNNDPLLNILQNDYKNKLVLFSGLENCDQQEEFTKSGKFITVNEYCRLYPDIYPIGECPKVGTEAYNENKEKIMKRLGITDESEIKTPLQVHAIFILGSPQRWEESIQLILDFMSTTDGHIASGALPKPGLKEHIPIHVGDPEDLYSKTIKREVLEKKIGVDAFAENIKGIYEKAYGAKLEIESFKNLNQEKFLYIMEKFELDFDDMKSVTWIRNDASHKKLENIEDQLHVIDVSGGSDISEKEQAGGKYFVVKTLEDGIKAFLKFE